jgi:hypothetical protein
VVALSGYKCQSYALKRPVPKLSISNLLRVFCHVNAMPNLLGGVLQPLLAVWRTLREVCVQGEADFAEHCSRSADQIDSSTAKGALEMKESI